MDGCEWMRMGDVDYNCFLEGKKATSDRIGRF